MPFEISPNKILRYPEELSVMRDGALPRVLNVEVDLSESCNLGCKHCDFPQHSETHMSVATAEQTRKLLNRWGTAAVVFTGGGEPTLCPLFKEHTESFGKHFDLGMYTNGVRSNFVDMADHFKWVYVSLDAAREEEWTVLKRAPGAFYRKVIQNIGEAAKKTTVGVGFLIHRGNSHLAVKMAHLGLEAGATYVHFRPVYSDSVVASTDVWEDRGHLKEAEKVTGVSVAWDKFEDAWHWKRDYSTCWASLFLRQIDAAGTIWACPTTRWKRRLGTVWDFDRLAEPLPVTDECRACCRGHGMNKVLDYIMQRGPHDSFV